MNSIVLAGGTAALLVLGGCGQKGPLYLPTDAVAARRATLVETLSPLQATPTTPTTPPAQLLMPPAAATPNTPAASSPVSVP
ncbi:LPS translocon maturation chaperone LptM [Rhodoferax koreense]|uniref:LPS translocon maturation chaperone LptM n=1 Tax=Rhodoferax koreensis TaxID=1842727 RepID=UPI001EF58E6E|nr:lipoprotein [Rhodoferax koreense]